jgi:hypothetical protein
MTISALNHSVPAGTGVGLPARVSPTPNLAGGAGGGPLPPRPDGKTADASDSQRPQYNVTVNQASQQPANDVVHQLSVVHQNNPAIGR